MNKDIKISDAEFEVMKVLWEKSPLTANDIIEKLSQKVDWAPNTIRTLVNRLAKKGVISHRKDGKTFLYHPEISKEKCVEAETTSFLERLFDGSLTPMLAHFAKSKGLSQEKYEQLKRLLDEED